MLREAVCVRGWMESSRWKTEGDCAVGVARLYATLVTAMVSVYHDTAQTLFFLPSDLFIILLTSLLWSGEVQRVLACWMACYRYLHLSRCRQRGVNAIDEKKTIVWRFFRDGWRLSQTGVVKVYAWLTKIIMPSPIGLYCFAPQKVEIRVL